MSKQEKFFHSQKRLLCKDADALDSLTELALNMRSTWKLNTKPMGSITNCFTGEA